MLLVCGFGLDFGFCVIAVYLVSGALFGCMSIMFRFVFLGMICYYFVLSICVVDWVWVVLSCLLGVWVCWVVFKVCLFRCFLMFCLMRACSLLLVCVKLRCFLYCFTWFGLSLG